MALVEHAATRVRRHLEVELDGPRGTVKIDGKDISQATRALQLTAAAGEIPELELDLHVFTSAITANTEMRIDVPEATAQALIAIGWKPPRPDLDGRDAGGLTALDKLAYAYPEVAALVRQLAAVTAEAGEQEQVIIALEHELNEERATRARGSEDRP